MKYIVCLLYLIFFSKSGITNFNGYWGCERCRTKGESVKNQTQAKKSRQLANKVGFGVVASGVDEGGHDNGGNGEAASVGGEEASAGGGEASAAGGGNGKGVVKFPQLDAPLRKDDDWHLYRDKEPGEPHTKASIAVLK